MGITPTLGSKRSHYLELLNVPARASCMQLWRASELTKGAVGSLGNFCGSLNTKPVPRLSCALPASLAAVLYYQLELPAEVSERLTGRHQNYVLGLAGQML